MPLENPTYVADLVETNPVGATDPRSEGDNHIRNIKKVLRSTFPGLIGRLWRKVSKSASGPLVQNDNYSLIDASGGVTLTPDPASALGNGWAVYVRASSGNVTINPAANINGADTYVVPNGYTALVMSDGVEFFAILMTNNAQPATKPFEIGTKCIFLQTTAPVGWTKLLTTAYNDAALRMTTGTVGTGGSDIFTSVFGVGKVTGSTAISIAQMPSHGHTTNAKTLGGGATTGLGSGGWDPTPGATIDANGGGQGHTHTMTGNIKYADVIPASLD